MLFGQQISRTICGPHKNQVLCAELLDVARMALEINPTALFQSKPKKNRGRPTKFCKACNIRGHNKDNCFMLHPEKAPPRWKLFIKKSQTPTISPSALQLMVFTEPPHLDSLCILNSHISARIDNCHFLHLENVWHIYSRASNYIIQDKANFNDYHLSSSKQIIWTGGGLAEIKGYGSVPMDWITQNGERVPVILTNILHVPGIITNLISVQKLDLKGIY